MCGEETRLCGGKMKLCEGEKNKDCKEGKEIRWRRLEAVFKRLRLMFKRGEEAVTGRKFVLWRE